MLCLRVSLLRMHGDLLLETTYWVARLAQIDSCMHMMDALLCTDKCSNTHSDRGREQPPEQRYQHPSAGNGDGA
jgi:hypothetical protein